MSSAASNTRTDSPSVSRRRWSMYNPENPAPTTTASKSVPRPAPFPRLFCCSLDMPFSPFVLLIVYYLRQDLPAGEGRGPIGPSVRFQTALTGTPRIVEASHVAIHAPPTRPGAPRGAPDGGMAECELGHGECQGSAGPLIRPAADRWWRGAGG